MFLAFGLFLASIRQWVIFLLFLYNIFHYEKKMKKNYKQYQQKINEKQVQKIGINKGQ